MIHKSLLFLATMPFLIALSACSMGEEIKRIEEVKRQRAVTDASRSTNLTGEQIFIRSCNTCHPSGRMGMGPSLIAMDQHFKTDEALKQIIRNGRGAMPGQPKQTINEQELDNLVGYLRQLNKDIKESEKK